MMIARIFQKKKRYERGGHIVAAHLAGSADEERVDAVLKPTNEEAKPSWKSLSWKTRRGSDETTAGKPVHHSCQPSWRQ
ncbi:hypothetical protein V5799_004835 [Amblyomma americanum]|uniref:Uncharacterized protein n=1 Tax=Amblyomma americanum TaxID=6943 RepID=A0AAQ4D4Z2_AMBAM